VKKPNFLEWKLIALVISGTVYIVSLTCCISICCYRRQNQVML